MSTLPEDVALPRAPAARTPRATARSIGRPRAEAILAGAAAAFSEKGFAATSVRQIATAADSSVGAIYYHFDSKERILREIICGNFRLVQEALDDRLGGLTDDPPLAFLTFVENHMEFFSRHLDEMRVMSHELDTLTEEAGEEVATLRRAYTARARMILRALRPDRSNRELNVDVLCLFGMLNWTYTWFHTVDGATSVPQLAAHMADLYLDGFLGDDGRRSLRKKTT